jgi:tetratricopeptide (TPR) repeat protein
MQCPVCRAVYRPSPTHSCRRCGLDLSPLITLHDQALWHHRQALESFRAFDYPTAIAENDRALALIPNQPDFQAFAGQLWACQGEFAKAIAAWEKALQLDPHQKKAEACLQCFKETGDKI